MAVTGRPKKDINWEEFDKLVSYQCTQAEIAAFFDCDIKTIDAACLRDRGESFSALWSKKRLFGRVRLRKAQMEIVEAKGPGATAMAIYLDKKMMPDENPDRPPEPPAALTAANNAKCLTFKEFCVKADYFDPFDKQIEMADFVIKNDQTRLLLGARGYGKTDYCTIMGVAYELYLCWFFKLDPAEYTTLIITKSASRNAQIVTEIKDACLKAGVEFDKENSKHLRLKGLVGQDHSVEAITIKTSMRGRHPKRIIMDDPVTDEDVSEAMRTLVKKKYDEAMKLTKNIAVIGQPAHEFDLYATLREVILKMEVPFGQIPELDADLEAMKLAGVDQNSIEMSYHLRIPKDGSSIFANIKYVDEFPAGKSVAFIDPSEGGDYTAISIVKGYFDGVAVKGAAWKKAWYHCLDEIVPLIVASGVAKVAFETNKFGLQPVLQLRKLLKPYKIGVVGIHSDSDKHAAIVSAGSYAHMIHLAKDSSKIYTDQVVKYEYNSKFDDSPDSLARCLIWLGLLRPKK